MQVENWNDLRFLLALHRQGSLTAAASALGVDQTTVTRRLQALERNTGAELYERLRGGAEFTPLGAEMVATAERLEAEMLELEARMLGGQSQMEGPVRITMPPYFAAELMGECRDFTRKYPGIDLELVTSNDVHSISKREADIALRVAFRLKVPEHLIGRKLAPCKIAVFGAPEFQDVPWEEVPWIGWMDASTGGTILEEYRQRWGGGPVAFRSTDGFAHVEAARAGAGVTVLICGCPRLTRGLVALTEPEPSGDIWLLTHPELQRSPRIRATLDYWYDVIERRAPAFAGLV